MYGLAAHAQQDSTGSGNARDAERAPVVADFLLRDGTWLSGALLRVDASSITIGDSGAASPRVIPSSSVVGGTVSTAMSQRGVSPWIDARDRGPFLELSTGDGLPGEAKLAKDQAVWIHPWLGSIRLDTGSIARVRFEWDGDIARTDDADSVLLKNGDVTRGFVESLGSEISIAPVDADDRGGIQSIPSDRVAAIAFARVGEAADPAPTMWFEDGTVLRVGSMAFDPAAGWTFAILDQGLATNRADLLARASATAETRVPPEPVEIMLDTASFAPLASHGAPQVTAPADTFRYDASRAVRVERAGRAPLGTARIAIDGPCRAVFAGAKDARRGRPVFSCEVVRPHRAQTGSRVSVRISVDGSVTEPIVLDASEARAAVRVEGPLGGEGRITIEVGDGGDGIVGDAVVLERAVIVWSDQS
ncbi:MAG: hypothetical protein ACKOYN_05475 [Planctomycetota bacterium]